MKHSFRSIHFALPVAECAQVLPVGVEKRSATDEEKERERHKEKGIRRGRRRGRKRRRATG